MSQQVIHTSEANIEITRQGDSLSSLSVIMPTWKHEDGHKISVFIPLFGLKTWANDSEDANTAIQEALRAFCIASEKFGQGVEKELQTIGWDIAEINGNKTLLNFSIKKSDFILQQIMETGEQFAQKELAIA